MPNSLVPAAREGKMTKVSIETWLQAAIADAERRGLPELKPFLEALASTTQALRSSDITATPGEPLSRPTSPR